MWNSFVTSVILRYSRIKIFFDTDDTLKMHPGVWGMKYSLVHISKWYYHALIRDVFIGRNYFLIFVFKIK